MLTNVLWCHILAKFDCELIIYSIIIVFVIFHGLSCNYIVFPRNQVN